MLDVVSAPSARALVDAVRRGNSTRLLDARYWLLDYEALARPAERTLSKQLLCSLAQAFPNPPALTMAEAQVTFSVFATENVLYFGQKALTPAHDLAEVDAALWARRPFVFSAALSVELAQSVVAVLRHQLARGRGPSAPPPTLFDPCCGSGTTLFAAAMAGFRVLGSDVNADFVAGTQENLLKHAGVGDSLQGLFVKDAAQKALPWRPFGTPSRAGLASPVAAADAVFCNFPWNEAVGQYHGETEQIVAALAADMRPGCQCAFVTKQPLPVGALRDMGYQVAAVVDVNGHGGRHRVAMDTGRNGEERGEERREGSDERRKKGDCCITFCSKAS